MNELKVQYGISSSVKFMAILSGAYLFIMGATLSIMQAMANQFSFYFFGGIAAILLAILLILTVTVWQPKPLITINNSAFEIYQPKQKIDGVIAWENVSQVGIGLSYITLQTTSNKDYKIDLENLLYADVKDVKTKLIEVCESKGIAYTNL